MKKYIRVLWMLLMDMMWMTPLFMLISTYLWSPQFSVSGVVHPTLLLPYALGAVLLAMCMVFFVQERRWIPGGIGLILGVWMIFLLLPNGTVGVKGISCALLALAYVYVLTLPRRVEGKAGEMMLGVGLGVIVFCWVFFWLSDLPEGNRKKMVAFIAWEGFAFIILSVLWLQSQVLNAASEKDCKAIPAGLFSANRRLMVPVIGLMFVLANLRGLRRLFNELLVRFLVWLSSLFPERGVAELAESPMLAQDPGVMPVTQEEPGLIAVILNYVFMFIGYVLVAAVAIGLLLVIGRAFMRMLRRLKVLPSFLDASIQPMDEMVKLSPERSMKRVSGQGRSRIYGRDNASQVRRAFYLVLQKYGRVNTNVQAATAEDVVASLQADPHEQQQFLEGYWLARYGQGQPEEETVRTAQNAARLPVEISRRKADDTGSSI